MVHRSDYSVVVIDSHAHVAFSQFDGDRDAVVQRARTSNVQWIEVGTDLEHSKQALALAQKYPRDIIGASVGVHPNDITLVSDNQWSDLEQLVKHSCTRAIGEVGLDYFRGGTFAEQLPGLKRFVSLAVTLQLPVIFHVRDQARNLATIDEPGSPENNQLRNANAHDDLIAWLSSLPPDQRPRGVIHTFSGSAEQALQYIDLGLFLSFSGVVTFPNAGTETQLVRSLPLDHLLIETDCPYLTPTPHRGKRNEPANVIFVAQKIAEFRELSLKDITRHTERNTKALFQV